MNTRLPLFQIESILRNHLYPFRCDCRAQDNSTLSVRLYKEPNQGEELTVLGITEDQCRDAANLVRLAQELRIELYATRSAMASQASPGVED